jgi:hypothetical protein
MALTNDYWPMTFPVDINGARSCPRISNKK